MNKEDLIVVVDGLDATQKRRLLEITQAMINGINKDELIQICKIYERAAERLLKQEAKNV